MNRKPLLILFAIILAVPNFIREDINEQLPFNNTERFHPALASVNSIDKLEKLVDNEALSRNISFRSPEYSLLLAYFISCRFYHGFSHYTLKENWIAALGERVTGIGLSCKVRPEEIMKHPNAACSQQALVMMEVLKRKKVDYRKVGFPHHYALEVKCDGKWYYFDPNMEPQMNLSQRLHENWNASNELLKKYYPAEKHPNLSYQFGDGETAIFGEVNEVPAARLRFFQSSTSILSKTAWCFPLLLLFVRKRKPRMYAVKPVNRNLTASANMHPLFSA